MSWAWLFFLVYAVFTAALAWRSGRGTDSSSSFAIGSGKMPWWMAGITLGACLASSSTFVILPGFVYASGTSALLGFTLPILLGIGLGLYTLAYRFQTIGGQHGALTVPHLLGAAYDSPRLRQLFAAFNVFNVAYLILITVGCGYVMEQALGVPYQWSVVGIVAFVFAYTGFGGATAHAWTNTLQGIVMVAVSLLVFFSGASLWPEMVADLSTTGFTDPESVLFGTALETYVVPVLIGFALATQPHLLSKALYVEDRRELRNTIGLGMLTYGIFSLVLFAGAYARLTLPAGVPQDQVMARYLVVAFGDGPLGALVSTAILAAAMSTLDGLLVAIAASVGNDLVPGKGSVWANRGVLLALGVATIAGALNPPALVLLLGQLGIYALVAASAGPLLAALYSRGVPPVGAAFSSAFVALAVHFGATLVVDNPAVACTAALLAAVPVAVVPAMRAPVTDPTPEVV
jgi:SSS family solute:Na+ symporter/sodium/pantothenate symporter